MSERQVGANMQILGVVLERGCLLSLPRVVEEAPLLHLPVPNQNAQFPQ